MMKLRGLGRPSVRPVFFFAARRRRSVSAGFSLLELIIVVTMIGILAGIALPNLIHQPRRANEAVLKNNLRTLREVIDQFHGDQGRYPESLDLLVEEDYLRSVPLDPLFGEAEWEEIYQEESFDEYDDYEDPYANDDFDDFDDWDDDSTTEAGAGIMDVRSKAEGEALNGTLYSEW